MRTLDGSSLDMRLNWNGLIVQISTKTDTGVLVLNETDFVITKLTPLVIKLSAVQTLSWFKLIISNDRNSLILINGLIWNWQQLTGQNGWNSFIESSPNSLLSNSNSNSSKKLLQLGQILTKLAYTTSEEWKLVEIIEH